jgi:hypothetical protein
MSRLRSVRALIWIALTMALSETGIHAQAQPQVELGRPPRAPAKPSTKKSSPDDTLAPAPANASWFDISSRTNVQNLYVNVFEAFQNVAYGWNGSVSSCAAGTLGQDYLDAGALRFNLFRGLSGVPAGITYDAVNNDPPEQQAALMMSANAQLSHSPPSNWLCYTSSGATAAGQSNLCSSYNNPNDPSCVAQYVDDSGSSNTEVGHRRWIFYPEQLRRVAISRIFSEPIIADFQLLVLLIPVGRFLRRQRFDDGGKYRG